MPESATPTDGSDALEFRVRVPTVVPATVGENTTDKLALAPAGRVYGKVKPCTVKLLPLILADEMLRLDPPVLLRARLCVWLPPTRTLPRLKPEGAFR